MKCNECNQTSLFKINYSKKTVKFNPKISNKKVMSLKEFAIVVLGIEPISTEIIAMYIGKLGYDIYNKGRYQIKILGKTRNGIKGQITY